MSQEVLKSVLSVIQHWDYSKYTETTNGANAATTNPVVEISRATVLCLHCFGNNSDKFKFCQHCGKQPKQAGSGLTAERVIGTEGSFQISIKTKRNIQDKHNEFLTYKALSQNSKAITSVMKSFEKFLFSFGLAKFTSTGCHARTFTVLDTSDSEVVNFCIWKSLSGVGRTHLHSIQCPLLGKTHSTMTASIWDVKK